MNLEDKINKLNIPEEQKRLVNEIFEDLMKKYESYPHSDAYFQGVADGINNCWKVVNNIVDDYCL